MTNGITADVGIDVEAARHVEELLETVKDIVTDSDVSINEAFYASLLVESSEMDDVYENLTSALAKDHRLLYDAVRTSLRAHHAIFANAAETFCSDRGLTEAFKNLGRRLL